MQILGINVYLGDDVEINDDEMDFISESISHSVETIKKKQNAKWKSFIYYCRYGKFPK